MRYSAFAGVAAFDDTPGLVTTPLQLVTECHTVSPSVSTLNIASRALSGTWCTRGKGCGCWLEAQTMDELFKICPKLLTVLIFTKLLSPITHSFEQNLTN